MERRSEGFPPRASCRSAIAATEEAPMPADRLPPRPASAAAAAAALLREGRAQAVAGRPEAALAALRRIAPGSPGHPEAQAEVARIEAARGRLTEARAALEAALKARPDSESLWGMLLDLARAGAGVPPAAVLARARKAGLPAAAMGRLEARLSAPPPFPAAPATGIAGAPEPALPAPLRPLFAQANAAARRGDNRAAVVLYDRILAARPDAAPALIRRAEARKTLGDLAGALADARAAVAAAPEVGGYWRVWAHAGRVAGDDPLLAELERRHAAQSPGSEDRRQMAFALAKAMEDTGAHDRLFGFLDEANALTRARFPYNPAADAEAAARLRRAWSPALAARWAGEGDATLAPIFVTGLPRSGTTLVEQILAAHPEVAGGGETGLLYAPLAAGAGRVLAEGVEGGAAFAAAGRAYAAEMVRRHPGAARVTDKSIATYAVLGFVPLALPRAKVVVVRRDPRDLGFSLYKSWFADGQHRYAARQEDIAGFIRLFAGQVAFWRKALPGEFLELSYEALVADPEAEVRRLLDFCGLPWDPACLEFHRAGRPVATLSAAQVRAPIRRDAVGAWQRHAASLAPFLAALGDPAALP
jgi:tetratricopeptide (TPR) repeat protein